MALEISGLTDRINDIDKQVEERCQKLERLINSYVEELRNQFARDTMPIPEKIRSMPLNQFMADYKGDLSSVLPKVRRTRSKSRKSSISMFVTPSKSDVETPTRRRSLRLQTPSTVRRRRQGEITYSSNGSPIESEETSGMSVTKAKLFVMLDESDATHMNLLIKDNKTNLETQIDVSNENDLMLLKKNGKKEQAKLMVQEYKKKMQALCDEVMAKLDNE